VKVTLIIYSNDAETVWNAFRLANTALAYEDEVTIFLLGKGVECNEIHSLKFDIQEQMSIFEEFGGKMIGCGICCESRTETMPLLLDELTCEMGSMQNLYALTKTADKIITF
jgi:uncharacterized protein involved in oxidation of intracellular sulfur